MILNFTIIYKYYGIGILLSQEKKEMGIFSSLQCKMQKFVIIPKITSKNGRQPPPKNNGRKKNTAYITNKVRPSSLKHVKKSI